MDEKNSLLVSVVVSVYNTEMYVEAAIKSILNQTIGFERNIELILVNNASMDSSGAICEKYAFLYPRNIRYIKLKENHGPCGARNAGLKTATGKYINYMDSDDLWECDALEKLTDFMQRNECSFVSGRLRHFDGREAWHILDWKYKKGHPLIVNILEHPKYIQLHLGSVLIKTYIAKQYEHDENMFHAEDAKYINQIIIDCGEYGICEDAVYLYRSRRTGDSVLQSVSRSVQWYHDTPEGVYKYLITKSFDKYKCVVEYVQRLIMYELQWRFAVQYINESVDIRRYKKQISELLQYIDDDIIIQQEPLWIERKIYALKLKYGLFVEKARFLFCIEDALHLKSVLVYNNKIHIQGFIRVPYDIAYEGLVLMFNDKKSDIEFDSYNQFDDVYSLSENIAHANTFFCIIPYILNLKIQFYLKQGESEILENIKIFHNSKISKEYVSVKKNCLMIN